MKNTSLQGTGVGAGLSTSNQKVSGHIQFKWHRPKPPNRSCRLAIGGDAGGRCLVLEEGLRLCSLPTAIRSRWQCLLLASAQPCHQNHTEWCSGKLGAHLQELINDKEEGKHSEQLEQSLEVKMLYG